MQTKQLSYYCLSNNSLLRPGKIMSTAIGNMTEFDNYDWKSDNYGQA